MNIKIVCISIVSVLTGAFSFAQSTVGVPDTYDSSQTNTFDVVEGTVVSTNGVLIVFEGELSMDTNITSSVDSSNGKKLASTQLYAQMQLFDDLPAVTSFTNSQAAVLGVFDDGSSTDGTLYGLSNVGGDVQWLQLTNDLSSATIPVTINETNLITIILRYPEGSYSDYEYTVSVSPLSNPSNQVTSLALNSPVTGNDGINNLSLVGEGSIASLSSVSGDPEPLSARIDFSVYSNNGEFLVDIYTIDENGNGQLKVYAYIGGEWVLLGTVDAEGSGSNHYQLSVSGLTVGESYLFKVIDEESRIHYSNGEIEVKSIEMQTVQLELDTFRIQFNSEEGMTYELRMSSDISLPVSQWSVEPVQVDGPDGWSEEMQQFQGMGPSTQIKVPRSQDKAFFKVMLIQNP